ncbi:MFS transporter [Psychrobacillus sp. FJAT-21963]|uniref:MFS transporter n=1 Tax=Psychrobacillus sp. FJAT-21963 TaxID=1712028 RepID=UPI0006F6CD58|nr:MFS transporter [Psychrobacillus sp. FJAT-21963]KQL35943.1 macrolide transporter [Psychrobacillus sp. FJAT-21963]
MWRNANVWIVLVGEMIAGLGLWSGVIGNLEFMQEKVPSDFHKSLILAGGLLAGVLMGPLAGRIIDQSKKKTVLIVSSVGRILSVLFMFVAIATGSIWWMVLFLISLQISAAFYFPALQATLPMIVNEKDLLQLNSWHMNIATIARVAGTAIAGLVLVYWSIQYLYIFSMVAYAGLLVFTCMLKLEEKEAVTVNGEKVKSGFKEIFPMLKDNTAVLMTVILTLIPLLFLGSFNLIVINISEIQDSSSIKGAIYAVEGFAFMLGTLVIKYIGSKWKVSNILFSFVIIIGLSEILLYFAESPALTLTTFALFGFSIGCFFPTAMTIFQKQVPKEFHGRFFSFRNMLDRVAFQVVLLSTGALLDIIGLQYMVVVFGLISVSLTCIFMLQMKKSKLAFN